MTLVVYTLMLSIHLLFGANEPALPVCGITALVVPMGKEIYATHLSDDQYHSHCLYGCTAAELIEKPNKPRTFEEFAFSNANGSALENADSSLVRLLNDLSMSNANTHGAGPSRSECN